jgi:hypothetical protein
MRMAAPHQQLNFQVLLTWDDRDWCVCACASTNRRASNCRGDCKRPAQIRE